MTPANSSSSKAARSTSSSAAPPTASPSAARRPRYTTGVVAFSLHDLTEVQAANGDAYLTNLLRLLALLDANDDSTDGFQIDAAANTAIGAAVTGTQDPGFRRQRGRLRR